MGTELSWIPMEQPLHMLYETIKSESPWFFNGGALTPKVWEAVRQDFLTALKQDGSEFPVVVLSTWRLVADCLQGDAQLCSQALQCMEESIREARCELSEIESQKGDAEKQIETNEDEENLEKEIQWLESKIASLQLEDRDDAYAEPTAPLWKHSKRQVKCPVRFHSDLKAENRTGGIVFPVFEEPGTDPPERSHKPIELKDVKELKEAVKLYGEDASFTIAIWQSFQYLTPGDYAQLARAIFSGGQYLLWLSEFHEQCKLTAAHNHQAGNPNWNYEMLTRTGQHQSLDAQIVYPGAVYAQIKAAANKTWNSLPITGTKTSITQVLQGPSEPFPDFVDRLMHTAGRIFGDPDKQCR